MMDAHPTPQQIERIVAETVSAFRHDECSTCDCFQGFLTQLALDAEEDVSTLLAPHRVPRDDMHGCLGCDPCPPGSAFADYLKKQQHASNGRGHRPR
jgi:hypothetical protein